MRHQLYEFESRCSFSDDSLLTAHKIMHHSRATAITFVWCGIVEYPTQYRLFYSSDDPTNNVAALSTTSKANPTRLSSLKGKEKDVTPCPQIIYHVYRTMKIEVTEALGRQS